ncbi:MAG TPA: Rieske (2Fe-2S) protein, partial [Nannocystis exedens]|nr:Rieske (2Fe-2S) protein [Nannocystis exedens]
MTEPKWIPALKLDALPVGEARVISHERQRIAVFRPQTEEFYAIDNRCPHEGYPLARGPVRDCVVTCPWHNFKFDLRDGQCVLGDEQVRVYAIRLRDRTIEIDVGEADARELRPRHLASLEKATRGGKIGQIAREVVRLLELGLSPQDLTLQAIRQDAAYAEYGTTHATPTAIDALHLARHSSDTQAALPLVQAFSIAAEANLRLPKRAVAEPVDPGDDPQAAGKRLRALVEQEALPQAEALLRGALARGFGVEIIEPWLLQLCADHLLSFGHPLIYTVKICDFLRGANWQFAD